MPGGGAQPVQVEYLGHDDQVVSVRLGGRLLCLRLPREDAWRRAVLSALSVAREGDLLRVRCLPVEGGWAVTAVE